MSGLCPSVSYSTSLFNSILLFLNQQFEKMLTGTLSKSLLLKPYKKNLDKQSEVIRKVLYCYRCCQLFKKTVCIINMRKFC